MSGPSEPVRLAPHDPGWAAAARREAQAIAAALGVDPGAIRHIGSTAVPGLIAKPILDLLGEAETLERVDTAAPALEQLGYEALGPYGIEGRRYFRRTVAGVRRHHLHVFRIGSPHVARHLALRDYLRARPARAAAYGALKARLAAAGADRRAYAEGKDALVAALEREALAWAQAGRPGPAAGSSEY